MHYVDYNFTWIIFNSILAFIPVVLVVVMRRKMQKVLLLLLGLLWFLFLPNTIYLVTDLQYFPYQAYRVGTPELIILIFQYLGLFAMGIITYLYALEPVNRIIGKYKLGRYSSYFFIALHFIVAFAVVLGKVQRTHSWYVFTNPGRVYADVLATITNQHLMIGVLLFGLLVNFFYFVFRKYFVALKKSSNKKK